MNPDQLAIATGAGYGMTPEQAISQLAPTLAKQMSVMSFGSKMDGSNVTQYDGISRPYSPTARNNFKDFYDNAWSVTKFSSVLVQVINVFMICNRIPNWNVTILH